MFDSRRPWKSLRRDEVDALLLRHPNRRHATETDVAAGDPGIPARPGRI